MPNFDKSVYSLGRLYGLAEQTLPRVFDDASRKKLACEAPMASVAEIMRVLMANHAVTPETDQRIGKILDGVDIETPEHISADLQSRWWAGYFAERPAPDHGLVAMRKRAHLTQAEAAEKIGAAQKDISRWERGVYSPSSDTLKKLSAVYGCAVDDLL